jgi:hypothetical protein
MVLPAKVGQPPKAAFVDDAGRKQVPPLRRRVRSGSGRNDKICGAFILAPVGVTGCVGGWLKILIVRWIRSSVRGLLERSGDAPCFGRAEKR